MCVRALPDCVCVYGLLALIRMRNGALPSQPRTAVTLVEMRQCYCVGSGCKRRISRQI